MMRVVQYRFNVFRRAFGRDPLPFEPLFFVPDSADPVEVAQEQAFRQLSEAASAVKVSFPKLLDFLGLARQ
jgi:hypothetical protein